jgi:hypothetical protein
MSARAEDDRVESYDRAVSRASLQHACSASEPLYFLACPPALDRRRLNQAQRRFRGHDPREPESARGQLSFWYFEAANVRQGANCAEGALDSMQNRLIPPLFGMAHRMHERHKLNEEALCAGCS